MYSLHVDLKSILAGTGITVTNNANEIEIGVDQTEIAPSFMTNSNNTEVANAGTDCRY